MVDEAPEQSTDGFRASLERYPMFLCAEMDTVLLAVFAGLFLFFLFLFALLTGPRGHGMEATPPLQPSPSHSFRQSVSSPLVDMYVFILISLKRQQE